jgi:post-segregation antitoxin (ccd killing protein)
LTLDVRALTDWLHNWADVDMSETETMIAAAKRYPLGKDKEAVLERVYKLNVAALTQKAIAASYAYAEKWEHTAHATPNTAWGFVHGLTRYSQTLGFADARHALDLAGGKVLDLAG